MFRDEERAIQSGSMVITEEKMTAIKHTEPQHEPEGDSFRGETPVNSVCLCMRPCECWYDEGWGLVGGRLFEGLV